MKRLSFQLSIWILCIGMSGCQSDDQRIFDKNADKRLNDVLQAYKKTLIAAPDGWKVTYFPNMAECGAWHFVMKFAEDGQVSMKSDHLESGALLSGAGGYQVKDFEGPGLSFTSFLPITKLVEASSNSPAGHYGENDFLFKAITPDTLSLRGRKHGADFVLTRAKAADWDAIDRHQEVIQSFEKPSKLFFRNLIFYKSGDRMQFEYDREYRYAHVKPAQDEPKKGIRVGFTDTHLVFSPPISRAGKTYDTLVYDKKNNRFVDKLTDPTAGIQYESQPAFPMEGYKDIGAPPLSANTLLFLIEQYNKNNSITNFYHTSISFSEKFKEVDKIIKYDLIEMQIDFEENKIYFIFNYDSKKINIDVSFDIKKENEKLFLSQSEEQYLNKASLDLLAPILDFLFDPKGLYVVKSKGFYKYASDTSYTLISASDTLVRVYMVSIH